MLIDTNILFLCARTGFPLAEEVERLVESPTLAVPQPVLREIGLLCRRGTRDAEIVRALAPRFVRLPGPGVGDRAIASLALARRALVVTADREFGRLLRDQGTDVLLPRDRHRLSRQAGRHPPRAGLRGRSPASRATVKKRPPLLGPDRPRESVHAR